MQAIISDTSIGVFVNGNIETVGAENPHFENIKEAIRNDDYALVERLICPRSIIEHSVKSLSAEDSIIRIVGDEVFYRGNRIHNTLTERLMKLIEEGFSANNLVLFLENLYHNPSNRSVNQLYTFLDKYSLPITEDGCFLAYKAIKNNYTDIYTGTIDNSIGATPHMERNLVNDDPDKGCSHGLHVGAIGYVKSYGSVTQKPTDSYGNRVMIVKVNPKDVVCVPKCSSFQKVRVTDYEVLCEMEDYNKVLEKTVYTSDVKIKEADSEFIPAPIAKKESDAVYYEGRREGILDASSGIPYSEPEGRSKKYTRGYRSGYRSVTGSSSTDIGEKSDQTSYSSGGDTIFTILWH